MFIKDKIRKKIEEILLSRYSENNLLIDFIKKNGIKIEYPKEVQFGDYSTPVAMQLTKILKKNPFEIAVNISEELKKDKNFSKIDIVNPGFINIFLSDFELINELKQIINQKENYKKPQKKNIKIIFEYVSANPTGPLHIGHARWASLGDTLSRILSWSGYDVFREFYVNDAGVQINNLNKTVFALKNNLEIPDDGYKGEYVKECLNFQGEPYEYFLKQQKETLKEFRVEFDNYFSEKNDLHDKKLVDKTIDELKKLDLIYEKDGAWWFKSQQSGDEKDRVLIKSDGSYTYFAPDIAYHKTKIDRGFDWIIDFFGADHHGYIKRIKSAVHALSHKKIKFDVILGQLVFLFRNGDPVRLSKRSGDIITLKEVMDEIGVDAMRYFLTSKKADTPLEFDIELAKSQTNENPVFYIQYAFARINSILNKAQEKNININNYEINNNNLNEIERRFVVKILKYPEEIFDAADNLEPHRITNYLYDTATLFHRFYEECKVIDEENLSKTKIRMLIVLAAKECLSTLLSLLAISAPHRM